MDQIRLPLPTEQLKAIDQARGDVPRTVWIRRAIEMALHNPAQLRQHVADEIRRRAR